MKKTIISLFMFIALSLSTDFVMGKTATFDESLNEINTYSQKFEYKKSLNLVSKLESKKDLTEAQNAELENLKKILTVKKLANDSLDAFEVTYDGFETSHKYYPKSNRSNITPYIITGNNKLEYKLYLYVVYYSKQRINPTELMLNYNGKNEKFPNFKMEEKILSREGEDWTRVVKIHLTVPKDKINIFKEIATTNAEFAFRAASDSKYKILTSNKNDMQILKDSLNVYKLLEEKKIKPGDVNF